MVGNELKASESGVDVHATFLINNMVLTEGVVFAFSAFIRETNPIR